MTNDVPMEHFGPWENQHRAYHGPCGVPPALWLYKHKQFIIVVVYTLRQSVDFNPIPEKSFTGFLACNICGAREPFCLIFVVQGNHFAYPKPHLGIIVGQNCDLAASWATWLKLQFREHLFQAQAPIFCGFHPLSWPKRTPGWAVLDLDKH